jgi:hypothetical protein
LYELYEIGRSSSGLINLRTVAKSIPKLPIEAYQLADKDNLHPFFAQAVNDVENVTHFLTQAT